MLDVVEEFSLFSVLEDDEDITGCVDELKVFDDMRVVEPSEHLDLSLDLLKDSLMLDLLFVEDLDGYLVIGDLVDGN